MSHESVVSRDSTRVATAYDPLTHARTHTLHKQNNADALAFSLPRWQRRAQEGGRVLVASMVGGNGGSLLGAGSTGVGLEGVTQPARRPHRHITRHVDPVPHVAWRGVCAAVGGSARFTS